MNLILLGLYFLFGIGRNLPSESLHFSGIGLVDILLMIVITFEITSKTNRNNLLKTIRSAHNLHQSILLIIVFSTLSFVVNAFIYDMEAKDFLEIIRYYYSFIIVVFTIYAIKKYGVFILIGFPLGVILTGIIAIMNPMNPDVVGTPQMFNPNVIGNALAISVFISSIIILMGYFTVGSALGVFSALLAFFTFSKGTWLMAILGILACLIAIQQGKNHRQNKLLIAWSKFSAISFLFGLIYIIYNNYELIRIVIEAKINATEFDATASEGGSFSARAGLILSAIRMFISNPLLGVGISNYEKVNKSLESELGSYYYDDDNPNSAFFYVLACMGFIAFIAFCFIYWIFIRQLSKLIRTSKLKRFIYTTIGAIIVFIGGNVQLEMLTAYYFWVLLGGIIGCNQFLRTPLNVHLKQL